jgi:hypothetical protein
VYALEDHNRRSSRRPSTATATKYSSPRMCLLSLLLPWVFAVDSCVCARRPQQAVKSAEVHAAALPLPGCCLRPPGATQHRCVICVVCVIAMFSFGFPSRHCQAEGAHVHAAALSLLGCCLPAPVTTQHRCVMCLFSRFISWFYVLTSRF